MEPNDFTYFIGSDLEYYGEMFMVHSVTMFENAKNDKRELIVAKKDDDNSVHGFIYSSELMHMEYFGDFDDIDSAYPEMRDWLTASKGWQRV
jgi:hypothetical protein